MGHHGMEPRGTMRPLFTQTWQQYFRQYLGFTFGFRANTFKKYPELIPLMAITTLSCTMALTCCYLSLVKRPDVRLVRSRGPPHEDVKPTQCTKYYNSQPWIYKPIPELEALKNDLKINEPEKRC